MDSAPLVPPNSFKDRSAGLIFFGILTVLGGLICALLVPFLVFTIYLPNRPGAPSQNLQTLMPALVCYSLGAVAGLWLGIGSIMKRRWARALLLIGAWSGLLVGLVSTVFLVITFPEMQKSILTSMPPNAPPAMQWIPLLAIGVLVVAFYFLLPGGWLLFYRGRNVKLTCEYYDSVIRWTDRCPLPVLAVAIWLFVSAASCLLMPLANLGVLPVFGTFIIGAPANAALVVLAIVCLYLMRQIYRLDSRSWWIVFIGVVLFAISALVTYSRHDILEVYRMLNFPPEQLAQMEKFNFLRGNLLYLSVVLWVAPALAYLVYVKKFFTGTVKAI